jgi:hypothetical protein
LRGGTDRTPIGPSGRRPSLKIRIGRPTLIRCPGRPQARDSEGGGGIKEGKFIKESFVLLEGFTMQYRYRWFSTGTIQLTSEVQLHSCGEHDFANCSTVILGKIAAWPIKTHLLLCYRIYPGKYPSKPAYMCKFTR